MHQKEERNLQRTRNKINTEAAIARKAVNRKVPCLFIIQMKRTGWTFPSAMRTRTKSSGILTNELRKFSRQILWGEEIQLAKPSQREMGKVVERMATTISYVGCVLVLLLLLFSLQLFTVFCLLCCCVDKAINSGFVNVLTSFYNGLSLPPSLSLSLLPSVTPSVDLSGH